MSTIQKRYDKACTDAELIRRGDAIKAIAAMRKIATGAENITPEAIGTLTAAELAVAMVKPVEATIQKYSYLQAAEKYRMVPCDEEITCMQCGYKRPRLRNENVFFCSICGACVGGLYEETPDPDDAPDPEAPGTSFIGGICDELERRPTPFEGETPTPSENETESKA